MSTSVNVEHRVQHASRQMTQNLAAKVTQVIWDDPRLRSTDSLLGVNVSPEGEVTLTGHVRGDMLKAVAGKRASQVPGVLRVVNGLVADTDLENDIALALAMDPTVYTCTDQLTVKVVLGVVHLSGTLRAADSDAATAALEQARKLALGTPGVREVVSTARAVVGSTAAAAEPVGGENGAAAPADAEKAVMAARLAVWRERAAAKRA